MDGDNFSGLLTRDHDSKPDPANGDHVGAYAIRQGTLTLGTNYTITFQPGAFLTGNAARLSQDTTWSLDGFNAAVLGLPGHSVTLWYFPSGSVSGPTT